MPRDKDPMWEYVSVEGPSKLLCKFCKTTFSGCSITRVKYHLAKVTGKDISPCISVPDDVNEKALGSVAALGEKNKRQKLADFWKSSSSSASCAGATSILVGSGNQTLQSMLKKREKEAADNAIVKCIVANNLPFNLLRSEEFKLACKAISEAGPGYQPPGSEVARTRILDELKSETDEYVDKVKKSWESSGCTLMSDGWTDARNRPHINLLASSPKGTIFLKSECAVGKKKDANYIFKFICETIEEIGPMNVVQFISDNASNYLAAANKLEDKYKNIFKVSCAAHCINLMFKEMDSLPVVSPILEDARKIIRFMYKTQYVMDLMHVHTKGKELKKPCATRFASNFLSLQSILEQEGALNYTVASTEWRDALQCRSEDGIEVRGIIQGASFWTCGKELIRVIEPLVKVLRMVDGNGSTSGYIYEAMDRAKEKIKDVFDGQVEKYEPFWKIIDERWNKSLHNDLHAATAYLNPQFHFLGYVKMDGEVKDGLERVVTRMICDPNDRKAIIGELRLYHQLNKEKLFTPMAIDSLKEFHPRVWWDMWGGNVPILKRLAIKLLSQPSSSSGCERNWSAFEGAQSKKRTRLTPERLRDLVYIRMNELYKKKSSKLESEDTLPLDLDKIGAFIEDEEIEDDDYDEGEPGEDNDVEGEDEENVEDGEGNIEDFSFLDA